MLKLGDWSLSPGAARVCSGDEQKHLDAKELAVLLHLIEAAPDAVSIEDLLARNWPGVVVGDNVVHQVVARLRKSLGDSARNPSYIETLPKHGYRMMVVPVNVDEPDGAFVKRGQPLPRLWPYAALVLMAGLAAYPVWMTIRDPVFTVYVHPFTAHSQDARFLHLARGFEDEVVHAISRNPAVAVVGSVLPSGARESDLVVEGRLRPTDQHRARLTLRVATSGQSIWSSNIDVDIEQPLADQIEVADQAGVTIAVISDSLRALRRGTNSDQALVAVLRAGLLAGRDTLEGARESLAYYDQAIRLDPEFAAAYALKAMTYRTLANWYAMKTSDAVERMRPLVGQSLALDPELPLALLLSAAIKLYDGDYVEAEQALQAALAAAGRKDSPRPYAAILLAHCGRFEESLEILDRAIQSNPVHPRYLEHYKAQFLWYARRYQDALALLDQILTVAPNDKRAHELRGHVLLSLGRYGEAVEELSWAFPVLQGWMKDAYATGGLEGIGRGYLRVADDIANGRVPFVPEQSAWRMYVRGHAMLGQPEQAVAWMEEGWALGDRWEFFYNRVYPWPGFDELRAHSAFSELMSQTVGNPATCPGFTS